MSLLEKKLSATPDSWDWQVRQDHQTLQAQLRTLVAALKIEIDPEDRRMVLSGLLGKLWPAVELHLRAEEEVLFRTLKRLISDEAHALILLRERHQFVRRSIRQLAELIQDPGRAEWIAITECCTRLKAHWEEHVIEMDRMGLDVLRYSLKPKELSLLRCALDALVKKAYEEEGWPKPSSRYESL